MQCIRNALEPTIWNPFVYAHDTDCTYWLIPLLSPVYFMDLEVRRPVYIHRRKLVNPLHCDRVVYRSKCNRIIKR